jgi:octaprenyl-diphosphate synthase
MDIEEIYILIEDDFRAVDRIIHARLGSDVGLINQISDHIVNGGGKRLRPMLLLLAARACGADSQRHFEAAAIVELIHTATLLHDDVVDGSGLRRGRQTANILWGNQASVLVGDFLHSRAFQMMVGIGSMRVMEIMADATNTIAEGEVLQLINSHDPDTDETRYLEVIRRKTAKLFEAGAQLGAVVTGRSSEEESALAQYGRCVGTAFQLIDDVLDYSASQHQLGKNIGDDLAEGQPTLPIIHAIANGTPTQRDLIRQAIKYGERDHMAAIQEAIAETGALAYTRERAIAEAAKAEAALAGLTRSTYRDALASLAALSVERTY